jgi:hypothetical protein
MRGAKWGRGSVRRTGGALGRLLARMLPNKLSLLSLGC